MSLPWNIINDKNISRSHREFLSQISSLKPVYDGPDSVRLPTISPISLITYIVTYSIIIYFSLRFNVLLSILNLGLSYPLGKELAKFIELKFLFFFFIFPAFLFLFNLNTAFFTLLSAAVLFPSFIRSRKSRLYFAISFTASNLLIEFSMREFPLKVVNIENKLDPYKLYLEIKERIESISLTYQVYIYAINKGRVGVFFILEYNMKDLRNRKFKEVIKTSFDELKTVLYIKMNQREWVLG